MQGYYGEVRMGIIRHSDGTEETVAVKKLKSQSLVLNNPESLDLQRECTIMKVISTEKIPLNNSLLRLVFFKYRI